MAASNVNPLLLGGILLTKQVWTTSKNPCIVQWPFLASWSAEVISPPLVPWFSVLPPLVCHWGTI